MRCIQCPLHQVRRVLFMIKLLHKCCEFLCSLLMLYNDTLFYIYKYSNNILFLGQFAGIYGTGAAVGTAAGRRRLSTFDYIDPINDNIYAVGRQSSYKNDRGYSNAIAYK
jgi:hypothetical protein